MGATISCMSAYTHNYLGGADWCLNKVSGIVKVSRIKVFQTSHIDEKYFIILGINVVKFSTTMKKGVFLFRGKYIYWKEETIPRQPFENQKLFPRKLRPSQGDIHKWSNFWGVFEPLPKPSPLKMIWNSQSIEPSCKVWKKSHLNTFFQACGKRFAPAKIRNFSQNLRFC